MYNEETDAWYRNPKFVYNHAIRYKFWRLYTDRGLVWNKSGLHSLQDRLNMDNKSPDCVIY